MTRISDETITKVKEAANVVEVLTACDVELVKRGVNYVGLCPFHDDRSIGSFIVNRKKNIYKCFACGATGDPVTYLMKSKNLTYVEAIKWLGEMYHIEVEGNVELKTRPKVQVKPVEKIEVKKPKKVPGTRTKKQTLVIWWNFIGAIDIPEEPEEQRETAQPT